MLVTTIFFLATSLNVVVGLVPQATTKFNIANNSIQSKQSFLLAESGSEDAYYRIKNNKNTTSLTIPTLNNGTVTTTIDESGATKTISTIGNVSSKERKARLITKAGDNSATKLDNGIHIGAGGLFIDQYAVVTGNVYSNGPVTGGSSTRYKINGDVTSAGNNGSISAYSNTTITFLKNVYAKTINKSKLNDGYKNNCNFGSNNNPACVSIDLDSIPIKPLNTVKEATISKLVDVADDVTIGSSGTTTYIKNTGVSPTSGKITCTDGQCTLGPIKIIGNLTIDSNADVILAGPVYVTGNITLKGSSKIRLSSFYGPKSLEAIITDGMIKTENNFEFLTNNDRYIMLLSKNTAGANKNSPYAIDFASTVTGNVILNTQKGGTRLDYSSKLKQVTAYYLNIKNSAQLNWLSADSLITYTFPTLGSKISSWQEE